MLSINEFINIFFKIKKANILFWGLPLLYSVLYASYGFESHDTGYILGLSWQLISGSVPYNEIISVRPPASYIFHSIFLFFSDYSIIVDRVFMYFQIAIYSYLAIFLLFKNYNLSNHTQKLLLSSLSFIFSVHTFPSMAWHTIDGIFFSVIGFYFILNYSNKYLKFLGGGILIIAALAKQPFFVSPLIAFFVLLYNKDYKSLWVTFSGMLLVVFLFVSYLNYSDSMSNFVSQITGQTKISDLFYSGFIKYLSLWKYFIFITLPPLFISYFFKRFSTKNYFFYLILWILLFSIIKYLNTDGYLKDVYSFADVLFNLAFLTIAFKLIKNKEFNPISLAFLGIAWASGISWGYQTVVLFMAPILFLLYYYLLFDKSNLKILILCLLSLVTFYSGYQNIYSIGRPIKRSEIKYKLEEIFPKLKLIYTDKQTFFEYDELNKITSNLENGFTVMPAEPLIHYLTGTKNLIGIDWLLDSEVNNLENIILKKLEQKNITVIVKKNKIFNSKIVNHIENNWEIYEEGEYFNVYKKVNN